MAMFVLATSNPVRAQQASSAPAIAALATGQAMQVAAATAASAMSTPSQAIARAPLMLGATLPLTALVAAYGADAALDEQTDCLAVAVYFEARGESLEGQLAVANVVMNRARSGRYPASWCEVVRQPWQFSFVRGGRFPRVDRSSAAWQRATAIARIAAEGLAAKVDPDVLWYHADYVSPSWGTRLKRVDKIGTHIFYRS